MCGIAGIASSAGSVDPDRLARMSALLVHRGPDSDGAFAADGVLGFWVPVIAIAGCFFLTSLVLARELWRAHP